MSALMSKGMMLPSLKIRIIIEKIKEALKIKASFMMQEMGLEPTQGRPRQILSLMRLPFRHSCVSVSNRFIITHDFYKCKLKF